MVKQEVNVHNEAGLHARPANVFVKTAAQFPCNVRISKGGKLFNGKSMVSVLSEGRKARSYGLFPGNRLGNGIATGSATGCGFPGFFRREVPSAP